LLPDVTTDVQPTPASGKGRRAEDSNLPKLARVGALLLLGCSAMAISAPLGRVAIGRPEGASSHKPTRFDVGYAAALVSRLGTVSSIVRSERHNRAVGGAPRSYHLVGRAIDVARRPHISHADIHAVLVAAGFRLVESLDEGDHSHFAFGAPGEPNARAELRVAAYPGTGSWASHGKQLRPNLVADVTAGTLRAPAGTLKVDLSGAARR
jgi:hypothetical protein